MSKKLPNFLNKRCIVTTAIVIIGLLFFLVTILRPFETCYVAFRFSSKVFTNFEIYRLKYPGSRLTESEVSYTSKVTMARYHTYHTTDDINTVLKYFEQKLPGFVHMIGSRVKIEPTYRNEFSAGETEFNSIFQELGRGTPYIEVYIFPSVTSGTTIQISEHWSSMGVPLWLTLLVR